MKKQQIVITIFVLLALGVLTFMYLQQQTGVGSFLDGTPFQLSDREGKAPIGDGGVVETVRFKPDVGEPLLSMFEAVEAVVDIDTSVVYGDIHPAEFSWTQGNAGSRVGAGDTFLRVSYSGYRAETASVSEQYIEGVHEALAGLGYEMDDPVALGDDLNITTTFQGDDVVCLTFQQADDGATLFSVTCGAADSSETIETEKTSVVDTGIKQVAELVGVDEDQVDLVRLTPVEWSNACLDLPIADACATVITPGFELVYEAQGQEFVFRSNNSGSNFQQVE